VLVATSNLSKGSRGWVNTALTMVVEPPGAKGSVATKSKGVESAGGDSSGWT
jgi:hypothetical protein